MGGWAVVTVSKQAETAGVIYSRARYEQKREELFETTSDATRNTLKGIHSFFIRTSNFGVEAECS